MSSVEPTIFYISALNITVDALKALLTSEATTDPVESDVLAQVDITLSEAKNLFHFKVEGDVNNLSDNSMTYKLNYVAQTPVDASGVPTVVLVSKYLSETECVGSGSHGRDVVYEDYTRSKLSPVERSVS